MIGLESKEWDMILGAIEAFRENEEGWINDDRESVRQEARKTIEKLDKLYEKVNLIWKTMRYRLPDKLQLEQVRKWKEPK